MQSICKCFKKKSFKNKITLKNKQTNKCNTLSFLVKKKIIYMFTLGIQINDNDTTDVFVMLTLTSSL